jgi:H+/gluconate symporter-like permease
MRRPDAEPTGRIFRTTVHKSEAALAIFRQRRKKMRQQPLRQIEDTVTSIFVLLVLGAMGFFGLVVLMLTLALGF